MQNEDFSELLTPTFNAAQFANDLLLSTSTSHDTLDLATPCKRIAYDLSELDNRTKATISQNPGLVVDQLYKEHASSQAVHEGLAPGLHYLDTAFQRVQEEVQEPYQRATKLQLALSKVHQTADILRDALVYIHLANRILEATGPGAPRLSPQSATVVTGLLGQLQLTVQGNVNLRSLQVVKGLETSVAKDGRGKLLQYLTAAVAAECQTLLKGGQSESITTLASNLHSVAPQELNATIQRAVLQHAAANAQALSRTINAVRTFPETMAGVAKAGHAVYTLERVLAPVARAPSAPGKSPRDVFWVRVATNFKRDVDVSFKRGGPVGKTLQRNYDGLIAAINKYMPSSSDTDDYTGHRDAMVKSIALLGGQSTGAQGK